MSRGVAARSTPAPRLPRADGFTLLEVLAAVAILSIWFIVIAGSAIQGLRAEGIGRRQLEAALIADRTLAELETATLGGGVPEPIDEDVSEQGIYQLTVSVRPFVDPAAPPPTAPAAAGADAAAGPPEDLAPLLGRELAARAGDLRVLDVRVAWLEGGAERSVERRTYAFDLETAAKAYEEAGLATPTAPGTANDPSGAPQTAPVPGAIP